MVYLSPHLVLLLGLVVLLERNRYAVLLVIATLLVSLPFAGMGISSCCFERPCVLVLQISLIMGCPSGCSATCFSFSWSLSLVITPVKDLHRLAIASYSVQRITSS
jgi:hypothetical protein